MFSKEEARKLREDFWIAFGKSYPRKWILYKTKIKGLSFKFHFNSKRAMVSLDIDTDLEQRVLLWEKLTSLKSILKEEYLPNAIYDDFYALDNEKEISRIYVTLEDVSIHNKNTWQETMQFLYATMEKVEAFFLEYRSILEA